jgi:hypothetical protein
VLKKEMGGENLKHRSAFALPGRHYRYRRQLTSFFGYESAYEAFQDWEIDD